MKVMKGFLEKVTFGLTFEERILMFGGEMERAFQEQGKGVSVGTEAGMHQSQVRRGNCLVWYKYSVLEGEKWGQDFEGQDG